MLTRSRALVDIEWSARPTRAVDNKSLDASGVSGSLIDNLFVIQLTAAASTPRYMPDAHYRSVKLMGNILVAASSFFFLETAFEMYFLTFTQRQQQMLGFSLAHIAPPILILVFLSEFAFVCLAVFALVVQILKLAGRLKSLGRYSTFMLVVLCVQIVHGLLLLTYDRWAVALFP